MSTKEMLYRTIDTLTEEESEMLFSIAKILFAKKKNSDLTKAQEAYDTIAKLRKPYSTITDEDDKEAYYRYLEEKYENLD